MTGAEMKAIREGLGLSQVQFGNAIGYTAATRNTVSVTVDRYERGLRPIPKWIAATVRALDTDGLIEFVSTYKGPDDKAEFARRLSRFLTNGIPA